MDTKCRRMSSEQASPRAVGRKARNSFFSPTSSTSSLSQNSSPPRRRDALKSMLHNVISPRSTAVPEYRGVRYREELNKYVTEIRPTRCSKKIWLGTYDTAEEAARAFDIGNLCCKKNLPLNFPDSPCMLKRISSHLSPEAQRSAIAKLAKEVAKEFARVVNNNSASEFETMNMGEVAERAAAEMVQLEPRPESIPRTQHLAAAGVCSLTYIEQLDEKVDYAIEEVAMAMPLAEGAGHGSHSSWSFDLSQVATAMPLEEGAGRGSHSWSFDLTQVILDDDLSGIPNLIDAPNDSVSEYNIGEVYYYSHVMQ